MDFKELYEKYNWGQVTKEEQELLEELKTLNSEIYEVNLLEDTYEKTDNGFEIEATADKLDGKIIIEYNNHEFIFTIVES